MEGIGIVRRNLFWLSDEQWKRIEPHLPTDVRAIERTDDRVISGIVHVLNRSQNQKCQAAPIKTGK
jgi:transposase